mgnify:CR=1 FL=1
MNDKPKELEEHSAHIFEMGCMEQRVYLKNDADAVIEAKDAEITEIKQRYNDMDIAHTVHIAKMNAKIEELESNERRLKRALWLARAERAHLKVLEYWPDYCHNAHCRIAEQKWDKVERKCRAMAEKFK